MLLLVINFFIYICEKIKLNKCIKHYIALTLMTP